MNKKHNLFSLIVMLSLLIGAFNYDVIYANTQTDASATFEIPAPTEPTSPLDPEDPSKELEPVDEGTGSVGYLTLDYVPSLAFDEQTITRKSLEIESSSLKPFIQVSDMRGTGDGWHVQASLSSFVLTDGSHTLEDVQITMINPVVKTNGKSDKFGPQANSKIVLTSEDKGQSVDVALAPKDHGMGTWLVTWLADSNKKTNNNIVMSVDTRDARVGNYNATITWRFLLTP